MQITPATARMIARKSGGVAFTVEDLGTPQVNIAYGAWYLRYLHAAATPATRRSRSRPTTAARATSTAGSPRARGATRTSRSRRSRSRRRAPTCSASRAPSASTGARTRASSGSGPRVSRGSALIPVRAATCGAYHRRDDPFVAHVLVVAAVRRPRVSRTVRRAALGRPVARLRRDSRPPVGAPFRPLPGGQIRCRPSCRPRPRDRRRGRAVAARRPPPLRRSRGRDRARPVAVPRAHRRPPDRPAARRPPVRHAREPRPPAGRWASSCSCSIADYQMFTDRAAARGLPDDVEGQVADYLAAGHRPGARDDLRPHPGRGAQPAPAAVPQPRERRRGRRATRPSRRSRGLRRRRRRAR